MRTARLLVRVAVSSLRSQQEVVVSTTLRSLASAAETSASSPPPRLGWSTMGLGFAAAALVGGVTASSAVAAVSAPPAPSETVTVGGLKIVASGGARIQAPPAPQPPKEEAAAAVAAPATVVFVLGGPGSGKGTQCAELVNEFDLVHLSAGDLLRAHVKSGTEDGNMVAEMIKNGTIVPSEVTIKLLLAAMSATGKQRFLIDGFPRNRENRDAFERVAGYDCAFVLFFDCPEDVLEARLLGRNEGRTDDNIESIKKRFKVFIESSLPVIDYYDQLGKVRRINTNRPVAEIYAELKALF